MRIRKVGSITCGMVMNVFGTHVLSAIVPEFDYEIVAVGFNCPGMRDASCQCAQGGGAGGSVEIRWGSNFSGIFADVLFCRHGHHRMDYE